MTAKYELAAIGNAIVDVIAPCEDAFLGAHHIAKGTMSLIDEHRAETLYRLMETGTEVSGGSAANTAAGFASFGGRAAFVGKVREDRLGETFAGDMARIGVHFATPKADGGPATARCLIFVTPDAQRSMNTYLGACRELGPDDIDADLIAASQVLYLEGYLWDPENAKDAIRRSIAAARGAGRAVALTLSDPFCVGRWRDEFRALIGGDVDILFANEEEILALTETDSFDAALQAVRELDVIAALTRSAKGSVIAGRGEVHVIDAEPVARVVDTTGAGDQYAAGFLFGLARGRPLAECGRLGGIAAAEVISHVGPRPETSLKALAATHGLL